MINITKEQARDRYALLPSSLQDAVFSEQTTAIIASVGEQYHIPDDKLETISSLVGWVLLGFLHLEDLPKEISEGTNLSSQLASDVTGSLTNKIFSSIKSDIDKAFAPVPHEKIPEGPSIIQAEALSPSAPAIIKPSILSDVGWSKMPAPASMPKSSSLSGAPSIPMPTPVPMPAPAPTAPAPVMLHEDTSFKAVEKNAGFTLARPGGGAEVTIGKSSAQAPTRPAVLEFGGVKPPVSKPLTPGAPNSNSSVISATPFSSIPTASGGPRNVSQITAAPAAPAPISAPAPMPKPPVAPIPPSPMGTTAPIPQPPRPPQPPTPPDNTKPIVKDFL